MNAATARRLLIGLGVFLAAGTLLLFARGDPQASKTARQLLAVAVFVGGAFWLGYRFRVVPRRASFRDQTQVIGFRAEPGDPQGLLDTEFALFRWAGSVRDIENTAVGRRHGEEVVIADYWFAPTSAEQRDDYERYTCVIAPAGVSWSNLTVVPERFASRLRDAVGMRDLETESEAFNRAFDLRGTDRQFASAFVDARMMAWLLQQDQGVGFEVLGGRVMVFRRRATASLGDVSEALALYDAFLAHIPNVV
jgi:hypothetical protein